MFLVPACAAEAPLASDTNAAATEGALTTFERDFGDAKVHVWREGDLVKGELEANRFVESGLTLSADGRGELWVERAGTMRRYSLVGNEAIHSDLVKLADHFHVTWSGVIGGNGSTTIIQ